MVQQLPIRYWLRRNTRAMWDLLDPILPDGDIAYSTDTHEFRVGDGMHQWSDIPSVSGPQGEPGMPGVGMPTGGTTGQIVRKASNTNYDFEYYTPDYIRSTTVAKISQGTTAPTSPATGDLWIDTN